MKAGAGAGAGGGVDENDGEEEDPDDEMPIEAQREEASVITSDYFAHHIHKRSKLYKTQ